MKQIESQLSSITMWLPAQARHARHARRESDGNLGGTCGIDRVVRRVLGAPPSREAEFTEFVEAASARLLRAALVLLRIPREAEDALRCAAVDVPARNARAPGLEVSSRFALVVRWERWRYRARHPVRSGASSTLPRSVVLSFTEGSTAAMYFVRVPAACPPSSEVLVFRYMLDASVADSRRLDIAEGTVKSAAVPRA